MSEELDSSEEILDNHKSEDSSEEYEITKEQIDKLIKQIEHNLAKDV